MTSGRVVALLLLFTPVCVFSQDQSKSTQYQSAGNRHQRLLQDADVCCGAGQQGFGLDASGALYDLHSGECKDCAEN
jgi:hypothetical protein